MGEAVGLGGVVSDIVGVRVGVIVGLGRVGRAGRIGGMDNVDGIGRSVVEREARSVQGRESTDIYFRDSGLLMEFWKGIETNVLRRGGRRLVSDGHLSV